MTFVSFKCCDTCGNRVGDDGIQIDKVERVGPPHELGEHYPSAYGGPAHRRPLSFLHFCGWPCLLGWAVRMRDEAHAKEHP